MNRDFLEMIKTRRSTRSFKPDSVPEDLLDAVLEAGTYATTGEVPPVSCYNRGVR